jgi:hypothetical protein
MEDGTYPRSLIGYRDMFIKTELLVSYFLLEITNQNAVCLCSSTLLSADQVSAHTG